MTSGAWTGKTTQDSFTHHIHFLVSPVAWSSCRFCCALTIQGSLVISFFNVVAVLALELCRLVQSDRRKVHLPLSANLGQSALLQAVHVSPCSCVFMCPPLRHGISALLKELIFKSCSTLCLETGTHKALIDQE